ncbi:TBC1 domain family member 1 [Panulirus ornatus]|uniref:TBC1 domain family member 1 n=1 Tax=Panulirus ornatus TaxID=150431 RepID=UPI003A88CAF3
MEGVDGAGVRGETGETFSLVYRGSTEVDRHYSKPMLPWIISEIKNRQKSVEVIVEIDRGNVTVSDRSTGVVILSHTVKQIHKCVMEQADHTCFLYTLKPVDKEQGLVSGALGYVAASDPSQLIPANVPADQNYQCHLLQAPNEQQVRSFFACLRQQPREAQPSPENSVLSSLNSLPDLYVHNESQFFEVLFVGRVKVSHSKVPPSFIDEALSAFKLREKTRQRHTSGDATRSQPNTAAITYQQEGSGFSVPNIVFTSLLHDSDTGSRSRSNSRDLGKTSPSDQGKQEHEDKETQKHPKVRFTLWSSTEQPPDSPTKTANPLSSLTGPPSSMEVGTPVSNQPSLPPPVEMVTYSRSASVSEGEYETPASESLGDQKELSESEGEAKAELTVVEPFRQRLRTISGDSSILFRRPIPGQDHGMRARAGSIGSMTQKSRGYRHGESELKMLSHDFNRTMLFHIGRSEIQLINPEVKSVQLNKNFKDVAHCCQGIKQNDHFGFICRELNGETPCYLGYVFKCQFSSVTDEIMQALSKAFTAVHEAQVRERQENLLCEQCPMKWFSQLCAEVEGLPAAKAHITIKKRLSSLPDEEKDILIAKYEGAETSDTQLQNNILMMLLRAHFESKQATHSHTALPGGGVRPDNQIGANLESSLRRAKKSLTTSFNQLLKREGREGDNTEKEIVSEEDPPSSIPANVIEKPHPFPVQTPSKVRMEGLSDSPLGHRPRSSTVSSSGGDSMRREFLAKRAAAKPKLTCPKVEVEHDSQVSPKRNIFLKVGSPAPRGSSEEDSSGDGKLQNKSATSFRHAILQRVVSPPKKSDSLGHLGSRGSKGNAEKIVSEKRSKVQLKMIWKKAVFQQILLNRFERENQRLRAHQQEVALQRVRLNYEEEDIPVEAIQAWQLMLSRPLARIDSNILHSGIKQGVPKSVRGEVWQLLMHQYLAQNQKLQPQIHGYNKPYESMIKELTSQHHAILIDLGRTFPTHPYYMQTLGPGQLALFNVLKAYSLLDKDVGYCQGLSFVGGVLLLHVEEEAAYNLLKHLMYVMGCRRQYRPDLVGLQVQMYQMSRLLHDQLRSLYDHFETHEVTPQLFAAPWFLTLFSSQFPLSFVSRVFDLIFMEGMEAVFRVALVLLRTHEEALLACDTFEQIMDCLKSSMPSLHIQQMGNIISQACECSLSQELQAYEVEYHVLQEELALSPQNDADFNKLKEANKNLKRQNLDLLEQLHHSNSHQHALETSNQSLQQSQHHLEVRVRWLELERNNLKQLVNLLAQNLPPETLSSIPANFQRFLPADTSKAEKKETPNQEIESGQKEVIKEVDGMSSSLPSHNNHKHEVHGGSRSVTMDYGMMQRYIKNLVSHD